MKFWYPLIYHDGGGLIKVIVFHGKSETMEETFETHRLALRASAQEKNSQTIKINTFEISILVNRHQ